MATYYRSGKTFTVSYRLKGRPRAYLYGIKTERAAKQATARKATEEDLARAGLHTADPRADRHAEHLLSPVAGHLDAWERSIVAKGKSAKHAGQQRAHAARLLAASGAKRLDRVSPDRVQAAAKALLDGGLSARTVNAGLQAVGQFARWLSKPPSRWPSNVLAGGLERFAETERRRARREMAEDEILRVIAAAEADDGRSPGRRPSLPGPDRAKLYLVALYTGFRQSACLSLDKACFQVDPRMTRPFVRLAAAHNKNRKDRDQPVPRDFAAAMHDWLDRRPAGPVWRPAAHAHRETWMKRDMAAARHAWVDEAPAGPAREARAKSDFLLYRDSHGRFADFHGWRHTGISRVVRHAGLKAGQVWADHSSPVVTAKYAHMNLVDEAKSLDALPPVDPPGEADGKKRSGAG